MLPSAIEPQQPSPSSPDSGFDPLSIPAAQSYAGGGLLFPTTGRGGDTGNGAYFLLFVVGGTGAALALVASGYALRLLRTRLARSSSPGYGPLIQRYRDDDGEATAHSTHHGLGASLRLAILCLAALGTFSSGVEGGLAFLNLVDRSSLVCCMQFGIWVFLLIQCAILYFCPPGIQPFGIAWRAGLTSAIALAVLVVQSYVEGPFDTLDKASTVLRGVQSLGAIGISILCFMIPRRPDVFHEGLIVDRQFTTSLLGWISFSWAELVIRRSEQLQSLTTDDLPELDHHTRVQTVYNRWKSMLPGHDVLGIWQMWRSMLRSHRTAIIAQVIIATLLSVFSFVPQFALLRILILLEAGGSNLSSLWIPTLGLGLSVMTSATLETLKYWISYNILAIRVQQQLSLAVFDKAVRIKPGDSHSSPVNLVAIDVKNIADFATFSFLIYESPLKLGLASSFLIYLLGWRTLVAGLAVLGVLTLFNTLAGRAYSGCQRNLMQHRDHRLQVLGEMLQGLRQIKFSAQEGSWRDRINRLRDIEMRAQWTVAFWQVTFVSLSFISPIMLSATCLSVYVSQAGELSAATAFTSISVLSVIEVSMSILPDLISYLLNARVSMQRVTDYLAQPDRVVQITPCPDVQFHNASVGWSGCEKGAGTLRGLNLDFPSNALSIITGPTGSGKSLLLSSILGEADILSGVVCAPIPPPFAEIAHWSEPQTWLHDSAIAYVSQTPWLRNSTIRDNILLGLPLVETRYAEVLAACALQTDLTSLSLGDQTPVTGRGANLSGGQRWRICLARALYSRARLLLLDDIFSALDVHTREHIYQHVLCEPRWLGGRTCILVTHHLDLCQSQAKYLVCLENGTVQSARTLDGPPSYSTLDSAEDHGGTGIAYSKQDPIPVSADDMPLTSSDRDGKDTDQRGSPPVSVFLREGGSVWQWLVLGVSFVSYGSFMLARAWWVHIWTDNSSATANSNISPRPEDDILYYAGIYITLSVVTCLFGVCRTYFSLYAALNASQSLFRSMLSAVLHAPLQWHDQIPLGDILSRFAADINVLDVRIGDELRATLEYTMDVAIAVVAGSLVNPYLLLVSAGLLAMYIWYARRFITASRQLKSLENALKGPILEHVSTIISGLPTVRAAGQVELALQEFRDRVSQHARAFWNLWLLNRWLSFRVNILGAALCTLSAVGVVYVPGISPSIAGFAITFTIEVSLVMALSIRRYVNLEQGLNSLSRIHAFASIPVEEDGSDQVRDLPDTWPQQGTLEVSQLVVRHAAHLPPVLNGISFTIPANSRVGVVGRTGAGKSSLVLALFRFLEAQEGSILVDGVDISQVRLQQLRSRLTIIPQHPVLFRGTIRSNLDPFDEYDDEVLLSSLQAVGWQQATDTLTPESSYMAVKQSPDDGEHPTERDPLLPGKRPSKLLTQIVTDCGENLSHGQQQLLCLARAIIRRPKIMILDEATSAVDKTTDDLIQRSLQAAMMRYHTTLLVIAHRLKTIVDSDLLLVMDRGRVVESGSPRELLLREDGCFRGMVQQDSERDLLERLILGE